MTKFDCHGTKRANPASLVDAGQWLLTRSRSGLLLFLLLLCAGSAPCRAAELPAPSAFKDAILSPPLSDLERRLLAAIHGGRFDHFSLLEAGLIAGGVEHEEELHRYCRRFDVLVESLRSSGNVRGMPHAQAQAIFEYLHRTLLHGGYCLQASDPRQALDHGRFNCVTATLLMNCMARRFDLKADAIQFPGHAMSRLVLPGETLDIETTCPLWFDLARDDNPKSSGQLRQISDAQLIATIYYNRGVDLLAERRFADAAAANAKAVRLDPNNATARGNYLATINNWGIELAAAGDYQKAADLFRLGLATDSTYAAFHANLVRLYREWTAQLCRDGREEVAIALLDRAARDQPGDPYFREAAIEIMRRLHGHFEP